MHELTGFTSDGNKYISNVKMQNSFVRDKPKNELIMGVDSISHSISSANNTDFYTHMCRIGMR